MNLFANYRDKHHRQNKGNVFAEAVVILPIIVAIAFFIVEFGNVLYLINSVNQIARSAARYASVTANYGDENDLLTSVNASSLVPDSSLLSLAITPAPNTTRALGDQITVTVTYAYTPVLNPFNIIDSSTSWAPMITGTCIASTSISTRGVLPLPTATPVLTLTTDTPACSQNGGTCSTNEECCSGLCDLDVSFTCQSN